MVVVGLEISSVTFVEQAVGGSLLTTVEDFKQEVMLPVSPVLFQVTAGGGGGVGSWCSWLTSESELDSEIESFA